MQMLLQIETTWLQTVTGIKVTREYNKDGVTTDLGDIQHTLSRSSNLTLSGASSMNLSMK